MTTDIATPTTPQDTAWDGALVFRLGYDGTAYSGFAEQPQPDVHTVAGELRCAFETFLRREVDLTCAGRTDAGVHALGQYVSVPATSAELEIPQRRWLRAMDALLPRDIAIGEVFRAPEGFSARFDARARTYIYRIADRPDRPVLTRGHVWWHRLPLDEDAMLEGAQHLVGEHDFKSFCKVASAVGKPTCRNVMEVGFERTCELGEDVLAFTITGNAFLHSMVRTIVGTLVEVGMHRREPSWVADALAACERTAAGPTAPAEGLTFASVRYDEGAFVPVP
ncbi:tRNA pseudouridine(38-40) synthase TruA [Collinsella sp. An2]|uniref:tRNA pseudouridine(38-40) synthase TruA n=1 Tax=Collinsella sp. An2 TaxID=1965585 RepID=UPI000B3962D3|nr:tRNA pseudouridine(38-40) synthase TruA [Collinsella sp. An2]OUP07182.1 tRNA pseudouridine(38-40) synthase TruA [Collinsella sp. An2]